MPLIDLFTKLSSVLDSSAIKAWQFFSFYVKICISKGIYLHNRIWSYVKVYNSKNYPQAGKHQKLNPIFTFYREQILQI